MAYKTKQSEIVLSYLKENSESHLTANDIALALAGKNVSKTTVYRHLEKLCREGMVRKYILEEGDSACYQYIGDDVCHSHFHLKCLICNKLLHLQCDHLSEIESHINARHNFKVDNSRTVFYGTCNECATQKEGKTK
ncbi:MAG: transcriptional repressor [Ruminiclostridium sp.]|nr:transcriptional repressor [Ruminiclostridium sp.]